MRLPNLFYIKIYLFISNICLSLSYTNKLKPTKMITHKLIPSFLPVFNGFYSTVFEPNEASEIEAPYTYDDYEFDYEGYHNEVSKNCVKVIADKLIEFGIKGISIKFELLSKPKEYNFANDSIWVKYRLTNEGLANVNKFLKNNKQAFADYIKQRYTSYDGFRSFWSNNSEVWFGEYLTNKKDLEHCFGAIMEFIFYVKEYGSFDLYEDVSNDYGIYLYATLKEGIANVDNDIQSYTEANYANKDSLTIACELNTIFENDGREFDWLTFDYIETRVNNYFNAIAKQTLNLFVK